MHGGHAPQLRLTLNGRKLPPVDAFATSNKATQVDDEELFPLANGAVVMQPFTLPHHSRMSKIEWEEVGGPVRCSSASVARALPPGIDLLSRGYGCPALLV